MAKRKSRKSVTLVLSEEKHPAVTVKPGTQLDVVAVRLVGQTRPGAKPIGGRLCGGTSTCLALVDIGAQVSNPPTK